ncbi:hypothetical protein XENORESO_016937 [Xenotaenia resolanae]|uniref:Uncharacterized protein n=1 Tax=Xenotaenia resolanae TaxID=208358 RepID=A0ABV0X9G3_9TELE
MKETVIDDIISLESSLNEDFLTLIDSGLQLTNTVTHRNTHYNRGSKTSCHNLVLPFTLFFNDNNKTFSNIYCLFLHVRASLDKSVSHIVFVHTSQNIFPSSSSA